MNLALWKVGLITECTPKTHRSWNFLFPSSSRCSLRNTVKLVPLVELPSGFPPRCEQSGFHLSSPSRRSSLGARPRAARQRSHRLRRSDEPHSRPAGGTRALLSTPPGAQGAAGPRALGDRGGRRQANRHPHGPDREGVAPGSPTDPAHVAHQGSVSVVSYV